MIGTAQILVSMAGRVLTLGTMRTITVRIDLLAALSDAKSLVRVNAALVRVGPALSVHTRMTGPNALGAAMV